MDTLTVGGQDLPVARPDDLADRLNASCGLSIVEARTLLVQSNLPSMVALAIAPLLTKPMGPSELGDLVAASDPVALAEALAPFYTEGADAKRK